ncbi:MAG: hypothetical protein R3B72_06070 [Polyangiaceae bacterium]
MDDDRERALERRIATLESELAELRGLLERRASPQETMRARLTCPHCGGRAVLHVERIMDRGDGNGAYPLSVDTKGFWVSKPVGAFEAFVCKGCGFTEWYVVDPQGIEGETQHARLIEVDDDKVGPYR